MDEDYLNFEAHGTTLHACYSWPG